MPRAHIVRRSPVHRSPRVRQMEGMFDLPAARASEQSWQIAFDLPPEWNIGLIVGPSGSGKTTVARELFGAHIVKDFPWPKTHSILDAFPAAMSIKEIVQLLSSVGFSSPPAWLRPFHVLSNGEQFRVTIARALSELAELCVVDEFTSVIDRTVAKIGSAAIAKTVRRRQQKFIALSCHYDVLPWLAPDWIFQPHLNKFEMPRGSLHRRRPPIALEIRRVHGPTAWRLFKAHHYLSENFHRAAKSFAAFVEGQPAAFQSLLDSPHPKRRNVVRGHRAVCLPDFQGVGIGNKLIETVAAAYRGLGKRVQSCTSHPALIRYRAGSPLWRCQVPPHIAPARGKSSRLGAWKPTARLTSTWEYIGPPMPESEAWRLVYS